MYYLKLNREQETADYSNHGNREILPARQRDSLGVIPEEVASIEPAPCDAGVPSRRSCGLCCALNQEQGAEGETLCEGFQNLAGCNIFICCYCCHDVIYLIN